MGDIATILTHRGQKFSKRGAGLFLKDVMHDGEWVHPITNAVITVTPAIRASVQENMKKWFANGNKTPMPDGHSVDTARNKGFWPGPFVSMGNDVLGLAQPLDQPTVTQMENGTADSVSVSWWSKFVDASKVAYENIFDHICLTNYPVIGQQRKFIKFTDLSGADVNVTDGFVFDKAALEQVAAPAEDPELLRALETLHRAVSGEDAGLYDVDLSQLTQAERIAFELSIRSLELAGNINKDGTFKGGFKGCVASGKSRALCAYIGRRAGKIK